MVPPSRVPNGPPIKGTPSRRRSINMNIKQEFCTPGGMGQLLAHSCIPNTSQNRQTQTRMAGHTHTHTHQIISPNTTHMVTNTILITKYAQKRFLRGGREEAAEPKYPSVVLGNIVEALAHQNRTIAIASDFRDGAKSPEIPQKEGVSASEIATQNCKSLATFHRTLKSQCKASEIARDFWGLRWASQSQIAKIATISVR